MITWQNVELMQERNRDLLRQADKERLIQQVAKAEAVTVWQKVKGLLAGAVQNEQATEEQSDVVCA